MAEYDIFELTGLAFDPCEKAPKKVKAAIDKAITGLQGLLGSTSQTQEREELNGKIKFLTDMKTQLFTPDDKLAPAYTEMADSRIQTAKQSLEALIRLEELSGKPKVVTNGTVRAMKRTTKLSEKSVKEVYSAHGFEVVKIDPLSAYPKFPTNAEKIYSDLAMLRASKDPNPNGADLTKIADLYAFAAYIGGEPDDTAAYRAMESSRLSTLLGDFATRNAMRNDDFGKLLVSIATMGKTYVFNKEENRQAYELHLRYKKKELSDLFAAIKLASPSQRLEAKFADACIKIIAREFGDSDVALSIYNQEAGLKDDPYIPEVASYQVQCGFCHTLNTFVSLADAQKSNRCQQCGKPLYRKCPKCNTLVMTADDSCPSCHYVFANAGLFGKYIAAAEDALLRGDLDKAREYFTSAETADPSEKTRTAAFKAKYDKKVAEYSVPLNTLKQLMSQKKYQAASDYIAGTVTTQYPGLNVSAQENVIRGVLTRCSQRMAQAGTGQKAAAVNLCLDILDECVDYRPAIDYLHSPAGVPGACQAIDYSVNNQKGEITVTWSGSGERAVSYVLVRKEGKLPPKNRTDGTVLVSGTSDVLYRDTAVVPGRSYGYSVFAVRQGVSSAPKSTVASVYVKISNLQYEQRGNSLQIRWRAPEQCQGVEVCKTVSGRKQLLTASARNSYDDRDLSLNVSYVYTLTAVYPDGGKSEPETFVYTLTPEITSFRITGTQQRDGSYVVGWNITQPGMDIRVMLGQQPVAETKSEKKQVVIQPGPNGFYVISASALSGGKWIQSENSLSINTFMPCEIDPQSVIIQEREQKNTGRSGSRVDIGFKVLGNIPNSVSGFVYFIRAKNSPDEAVPWVSPEEAVNADDGRRVSKDEYTAAREFRYPLSARNEDAYYLTMYTVFSAGGRSILSRPYKKKINRPLRADVFWSVGRSLFGAAKKLTLKIEPTRPIWRRPEFVLCVSTTGRPLKTAEDAGAKVLLRIPEKNYETAQTEIIETFDLPASKGMPISLFECGMVRDEKFILREE